MPLFNTVALEHTLPPNNAQQTRRDTIPTAKTANCPLCRMYRVQCNGAQGAEQWGAGQQDGRARAQQDGHRYEGLPHVSSEAHTWVVSCSIAPLTVIHSICGPSHRKAHNPLWDTVPGVWFSLPSWLRRCSTLQQIPAQFCDALCSL